MDNIDTSWKNFEEKNNSTRVHFINNIYISDADKQFLIKVSQNNIEYVKRHIERIKNIQIKSMCLLVAAVYSSVDMITFIIRLVDYKSYHINRRIHCGYQ